MTDRQTTHADDCWSWGQGHYECAVREIKALRADLMESDEIREKLGQLLTLTAKALKGDPPEGTWHSWHDLPEKATQLTEALRKLEEREQSDEDLLRQALQALDSGHPDIQLRTAITLRQRLGEQSLRKRIAWELERTAMGDGYYGDALRAAKEFPEATPSVQALLDRWATGNQDGLSDRTDLCTFALQIYMSDLEREKENKA